MNHPFPLRPWLSALFGLLLNLSLPGIAALPAGAGDLDGDGGATALDLVRLLNHIQAAGSPGHTNQLPAELLPYADLNEDRAIDQADVGLLRNAVLELRSVPSAMNTTASFRSIAAGARHSLALREDGTLWAWGLNHVGQLGDGTTNNRVLPVPVGTNFIWKAVAAGQDHSLALREDGTLWAWGYNYFGQLGDGTTTNRFSPVAVATNFTWKTISAGYRHSLALREDGTLWAWGDNYNSQLGDGTGGFYSQPRLSPVPVAINFTWKAISAGFLHSLALREDTILSSWGFTLYGALGDGTRETARRSPMPIATNFIWKAIEAGGEHSLALREDGTPWSWGRNNVGQLGDGTRTDRLSPVPVATNSTWKAIAASYDHNLALREDGTLWGWGQNNVGQLGDGTRTDRLLPMPVATNFTWKAIATGHAHSFALREDGTIWAWGDNYFGQLGDGTGGFYSQPRLSPVPVVFAPSPLRLYLGSTRGFPSRNVELPIHFRSPTNQPPAIVALQADIEFESAALSLGAPTEGDALPNHLVLSRELALGVRRVLIYSTNNTVFTNGVVVNLPFSVGPKVFHNPRIVLTNVILVRASATSAPFTSRPGGIAIVPVVVDSDDVAEGFITLPPDPVNERCFVVQSSSDLRSWANIVTNSVIGNVLQFVDPTLRPTSPRFYRAIACP